MARIYSVYIITNKKNGVLYTGVTNSLERRMHEHKQKVNIGFASKYNCTKLVYHSSSRYVLNAIAAEKTIKGWSRAKKVALIEAENPEWIDLAAEWD